MPIVIINKKPGGSPMFVRTPHPTDFRTTLEKEKYWANEQKLYIEGYNEDINGMLYYYLKNIKLKNRNDGSEYYPECRDVEILIFKEMAAAMAAGQSLFIVKGRGVGLSSIGMNMPHYFFRTMPNTNCLATSKNLETLSTIFSEKFVFSLKKLNKDIKPRVLYLRNTKKESHYRGGIQYIDDEGVLAFSESELMCRDTQKTDEAASNFSGSGVIYGFGDEAPLMKRFGKFFGSAIECFKDHSKNRMRGLLLLGGTVEADIPNDGIIALKKIWDSAAAMKMRTLWLPATYGKHVVNGISDHARAKEEILAELDELERAEKNGIIIEGALSSKAFRKNNPLTLEDVFDIASGDFWEAKTSEALKAQYKIVINSDPKWKPHVLIETGNDIVPEIAERSPILIHELPKPNVRYVIGVDGTATSTQTGTMTGSNYALVVLKLFEGIDAENFKVSAMMSVRPDSIEECYRKTVLIGRFYNKYGNCKIMAEGTQGNTDHFVSYLKRVDALNLAMRDPDNEKKWFKYRSGSVKDAQIKEGNIFIPDHASGIWFPQIIENLLLDVSKNADLRDAYLWALTGAGKDLHKSRPAEQAAPPNSLFYFDPVKGQYVNEAENTIEAFLSTLRL